MSKIIATRSSSKRGPIEQYKLDDGRILSHQEACDACDRGEIEGVATFTTRDGGTGLRSNRGQVGYSLQDLPSF